MSIISGFLGGIGRSVNNQKISTLTKIKPFAKENIKILNEEMVKESLKTISLDIPQLVKIPPGESLNEWLAMNVCDFFNEINFLNSIIMDYCTDVTCPTMSAGSKYEFWWSDGEFVKEPVQVSAPTYFILLMEWIQRTLRDPNIFPVEESIPFPKNFIDIVKTIFRRIYRVYCHLYCSHYVRLRNISSDTLLNSSFEHFYLFAKEFDCISEEDQKPLDQIIKIIEEKHKNIDSGNDRENNNEYNKENKSTSNLLKKHGRKRSKVKTLIGNLFEKQKPIRHKLSKNEYQLLELERPKLNRKRRSTNQFDFMEESPTKKIRCRQ